MSDNSKISWTDASWPVVTGCTHLSEGCDHCYAAKLTGGRLKHLSAYAGLAENGRFNGTVRLLPDRLDWPLRWRKPRKVFVSDMADLFHADVPDEFIARVWAVMAACPQHTFQVLTKRHARMRSLLSSEAHGERVAAELARLWGVGRVAPLRGPLSNVWLGVSVENQHWADVRIPALLDTPATIRFLSCEPLLGPLNIWHLIDPSMPSVDCDQCGDERFEDEIGVGHDRYIYDDDGREVCDEHGDHVEAWCDGPSAGTLPRRIDWIIAGGESGSGHRPMEIEWLKWITDHCRWAEVPLWVKQDSGPRAGQQGRIPDALWIHEFPRVTEAVPAA